MVQGKTQKEKNLKTEHFEELYFPNLEHHILSFADRQTLANASRVNKEFRDISRPLLDTKYEKYNKYKYSHGIHLAWIATRESPTIFINMFQDKWTYVHRCVNEQENEWEDNYTHASIDDYNTRLPLASDEEGAQEETNLFQRFYNLLNQTLVDKIGRRDMVSKRPFGVFYNPARIYDKQYYIKVSLENNAIYEVLMDVLTEHLRNTMKKGHVVDIKPIFKDSDYDVYGCILRVHPYGKPDIDYPDRYVYDSDQIYKEGKTILKTLFPEHKFHVAPDG